MGNKQENQMPPPGVSPARLALVSGTTSGIGVAVARHLLAGGWTVVGLARRESPLAHERYRHVQIDLRDLATVTARVTEEVGPLLTGCRRTGLVNNAAMTGPLRPFEMIDPSDLADVYRLNTAAPAWLMGFVLRHAPVDAAIRIVNVSSGGAERGYPGGAAYCASKAALRMIGLVAAAELDEPPAGVPSRDAAILSYGPGPVDTEMQAKSRAQRVEDFPWVRIFHEFEARGMVTPDRPAAEIVEFLESDGQPRFTEKSLQQ